MNRLAIVLISVLTRLLIKLKSEKPKVKPIIIIKKKKKSPKESIIHTTI